MINSVSTVSNAQATSATHAAQPRPKVTESAKQSTSSQQDTVHLSREALAATGDVDHDGDSH